MGCLTYRNRKREALHKRRPAEHPHQHTSPEICLVGGITVTVYKIPPRRYAHLSDRLNGVRARIARVVVRDFPTVSPSAVIGVNSGELLLPAAWRRSVFTRSV